MLEQKFLQVNSLQASINITFNNCFFLGFVNGLFLLFISFMILTEAVERLVEPPEVKHERLFVISVLGFLVNLVGKQWFTQP